MKDANLFQTTWSPILALLMTSIFLAGCGQKGALVYPQPTAAALEESETESDKEQTKKQAAEKTAPQQD